MLRALDLFCGAGGVSMGLHRAGFDVTGIDLHPQPRYPFRFLQADALAVDLDGYDLIWASPPCQAHTALRSRHQARTYADLIPATRARLRDAGGATIIENVPGAPLVNPTVLCGTMFGLGVDDGELWRHRLFETNYVIGPTPPCAHRGRARVVGVYGGSGGHSRRDGGPQMFLVAQRRIAMGIDWMTRAELSQAIPPAYSEFLARAFLAQRAAA